MKSRTIARLLAVCLFCVVLSAVACRGGQVEAPTPAAFQSSAFDEHVVGHGHAVIFIPGLGCGGDVWDGTIQHLGSGVQAHVLTLTGFAGLPPKGTFDLRAVHDQIEAYIKALHLDHPVVVGHSLGGVLALWLAETDPELGGVIDVEGLPFLTAVGKPDIAADQAKGVATQTRARMQGDRAQLAMMMKNIMATQITNPEQLAHFVDEANRSDQGALSNAMYDLMTTDLRPGLASIHVPVLIVAAEGTGFPPDSIHAVWHQQVDQIPHVDLEFVPGAKHFVMLDQPAAFFALVDRFLAEHAR